MKCQLRTNILRECNLSIGGVSEIFLINAEDFIKIEANKIILTDESSIYSIDVDKNAARFIQTTVNGNNKTYYNSNLTFYLPMLSENLEDNIDALALGEFKVLIKYNNGFWRFVSEETDINFKQTALSSDSGIADSDANGTTLTFECNSHTVGLLYDKKPEIEGEGGTSPIWELIESYCEVE